MICGKWKYVTAFPTATTFRYHQSIIQLENNRINWELKRQDNSVIKGYYNFTYEDTCIAATA